MATNGNAERKKKFRYYFIIWISFKSLEIDWISNNCLHETWQTLRKYRKQQKCERTNPEKLFNNAEEIFDHRRTVGKSTQLLLGLYWKRWKYCTKEGKRFLDKLERQQRTYCVVCVQKTTNISSDKQTIFVACACCSIESWQEPIQCIFTHD